jgi:hypothetical protein
MENRIWRIRAQSLSVSAAPPPTILQKCAENVGFLFFGYLNFFSACSHFSNLLMFFCSLQRHNFLILILVLSNEPPDCLVRNLLPETRMANVGGKSYILGNEPASASVILVAALAQECGRLRKTGMAM